jgi:hypothetical protein
MTRLSITNRLASFLAFAASLFMLDRALAEAFIPNDPLYPQQWNLDKQSTGALIDANVAAAWAKGWTGSGVLIGIVEGSIDGSHPDLQPNYAPQFNLGPTISDPHATNVAGVAAGRGGNGIGISGAAPFASIADLYLDLSTTSGWVQSQVAAILHRNDAFDIKNWSVYQNDAFVPQSGWSAAVQQAETAGVINVRISGNQNSNANLFGDKNIFGQIVVGGVASTGVRYQSSNYGSNLFVTAPTLGTDGLGITTTAPGGTYRTDFSGTSAAAPLVAGILALVEEAQPALDTRMAKHLLAHTSHVVDPNDNHLLPAYTNLAQLSDLSQVTPIGRWTTNAAGLTFNNDYGFGLIDAAELVDMSQDYIGVSPLVTSTTGTISVSTTVPEDDVWSQTFSLSATGPVEDLQVDLTMTGGFKSSVQVSVVSPSGTVSLLHDAYAYNDGAATPGTRQWSYVTNAFWGEDASGTWMVSIKDLPWIQAGEAASQVTWDSVAVTARIGALVPAGEGDFDADGDVDGNDYLRWQQNFGSTMNLPADDNHNGIVDAADYVLWRKHFGETSALASSQAQVPEPTTLVILLLGSIGSFAYRASLFRSISK